MAGRETVLIVDDESAIRELLREYLQGHGFNVIDAPHASRAIDALTRDADIRVVITDIVMPGSLSGFDLGRWINANRPGVKVIFVSAYPAAKMVSAAMATTPHLIQKPFHLATILQSVRSAVAEP